MDRVGISVATDSIKKGDRLIAASVPNLLQGHYLDGQPEKLEEDVVAHTKSSRAQGRGFEPRSGLLSPFVSATSVK